MKAGDQVKTLRNVKGATVLETAALVLEVVAPKAGDRWGRLLVKFSDGTEQWVSAHPDFTAASAPPT